MSTSDDRAWRGRRRAGLLLLLGLAVEAWSLAGLHTPPGFLAFALLGGSLMTAGIGCYLYSLKS